MRSHVLDRLPAVGSGRIRWGVVLVLYVAGAFLTLSSNLDWALALITTSILTPTTRIHPVNTLTISSNNTAARLLLTSTSCGR